MSDALQEPQEGHDLNRTADPATVDGAGARVAHVLRKYDPDAWGGTETHVVEIARGLAARGWRPEIHAPWGPRAQQRFLPPRVPLVPYHAFGPFVGPSEERAALRAIGGNLVSLDEPLRLALDRGLALAHVHTLGRLAGGVRTAMLWTRRPFVLSVHGPLLAPGGMAAAGEQRRRVLDLGQPFGMLLGARRVLRDATRIIVFNDEEREALADRLGPARIVRMNHGIAWRTFATGDAARADQRWPVLRGRPVVGMIGRIASAKNHVLALRAFMAGAPADHHLALAGAVMDPQYRVRLEREAQALGAAGRVHFLGNVAPGHVADLLARCRLILLTSSFETFGIAVVEAWAASRPVLFARRFGLRELAAHLGDARCVLDTLDERDWAAAIARFLADDELRRAAAAAGHAVVRVRYDIDAIAARLADLYDEILAEGRARGRALGAA